MGKVIHFQVTRCIDEYLTVDESTEGKAEMIRDWKRRYPKAIQQEAMYVLNLRKPFERVSLYQRTMTWLNRKKSGF